MSSQPATLPIRTRASAIGLGLACHILFAFGVGTMIAAMFFGMSRSLGRVPPQWSPAVNALLLLQFPLAHSLLLSRFGGPMLKRLAPSAIAGGMATTSYAMAASVQVLALFALWTPSGVIWWQAEGVAFWLLVTLYTIAWLLLLKAIWDAGLALQTGFLGWWAVAHNRVPKYPGLPRSGLFRLVRQPIYVAFALTVWTVPLWTPDQLVVALVLTAYCLAGPLLKEARFHRRFGTDFAAYAARTPYWLPWPRPLQRRNDLGIYEAPADWWDGSVRWMRLLRNLVPARFAFFDTVVSDWHGLAVLDLGCGGGFMTEALARRGAIVNGIDTSERAVTSAQWHAAATGLPIAYHCGRAEALPYRDGVFDVVVCVDVLEHVDDPAQVITEVRRVLRPDGLFLFDTVNRTPLASFIIVTLAETIFHLLPRGTHDPAMFIRPEELCQMLHEAGFHSERLAGLGPRGLNRRLDPVFGRYPTLAVQYIGGAL